MLKMSQSIVRNRGGKESGREREACVCVCVCVRERERERESKIMYKY